MANLDQVMNKLKKSQKSKVEDEPEEVESEVEEDQEEDEEEDDEEPEEEVPVKKVIKKKPDEKLTDEEIERLKMEEVGLLQNDGIFRAELLHRLNELCDLPKQLYILNSLLNKFIGDGEDDKSKK